MGNSTGRIYRFGGETCTAIDQNSEWLGQARQGTGAGTVVLPILISWTEFNVQPHSKYTCSSDSYKGKNSILFAGPSEIQGPTRRRVQLRLHEPLLPSQRNSLISITTLHERELDTLRGGVFE